MIISTDKNPQYIDEVKNNPQYIVDFVYNFFNIFYISILKSIIIKVT